MYSKQTCDSDLSSERDILCSSRLRHMNTVKVKFITQVLFPNVKKIKSWPLKTDLNCWYCSHSFKCRPVSIAEEFRDDTWYVKGVFCSFSCAQSHIIRESHATQTRLFLLKAFAKVCFDIGDIGTPSPPFYTLKKFGGHLSIKQFREIGMNQIPIKVFEGVFKPCKAAIRIQTNDADETTGFKLGKVMGIKRRQVSHVKQKKTTQMEMNKFDKFVRSK